MGKNIFVKITPAHKKCLNFNISLYFKSKKVATKCSSFSILTICYAAVCLILLKPCLLRLRRPPFSCTQAPFGYGQAAFGYGQPPTTAAHTNPG